MEETIFGMRLIVSDNLEKRRVQFRRPRSRARRIQNKWAKDPGNYRYERQILMMNMPTLGKTVVMDTETFRELKESLDALHPFSMMPPPAEMPRLRQNYSFFRMLAPQIIPWRSPIVNFSAVA